jgi:Zn-dependent M28 family amino/carboxypeptidase
MSAPAAGRGAGPNGPPFQVVRFQAGRPAAVPTITAGVALTNALFQGEKLSGAQVFEGAAAGTKLDSFALNGEKKIAIQTAVAKSAGSTQNVIGMVEGRDPVLKGEFIVISAHLDHVGLSAAAAGGDTVNNGADDDGSGSAALMAIARAYAQGAAKGIRPRRSVIFLWVTGEEKGLWGSQYFVQFPPVDISKVVANLNMDMVGRSKPQGYTDPPSYKLVAPGEVFVVGPRVSSDDMGAIVGKVAADVGKLKINDFYDTTAPDETHDNLGPQPNGQRIFYRSDHYNFAKMGIPVAFYTTGLHTDYHRVSDSPDKIDYALMETVTRNVAAVGWVIGNAAARPKLNAKLPDRLVDDMKAAQAAGWGKLTPAPPPGTKF